LFQSLNEFISSLLNFNDDLPELGILSVYLSDSHLVDRLGFLSNLVDFFLTIS